VLEASTVSVTRATQSPPPAATVSKAGFRPAPAEVKTCPSVPSLSIGPEPLIFSEWNSHSNDDNTYTMRRGIGFNHTNTSALSGFKIYPSAGNVTFDYWIYGMKPA